MGAGALNHWSPVPDRRMPKSVPLRAITVTRLEAGTPAAASEPSLPAAITRLSMKWSLLSMNLNTSSRCSTGASAPSTSERADLAEEQRGDGAVAVVPVVAHLQRLGDERLQVDRPAAAQGRTEHRTEHTIHPPEPLDHLGGKGAVAQHLAQTLVEGGVGDTVAGTVLDDRHRHRWRGHSGHGADCTVVVTW